MKTKLLSLSFLIGSLAAHAGPPEKYIRCDGEIDIPYVENSQGVFFDKECDTVYVMPPVAGDIRLSSLIPANPQYCDRILSISDEIVDLSKRIDAILAPSNPGSGGPLGNWGSAGRAKPELTEEQLALLDKYRDRQEKLEERLYKYRNYDGGLANIELRLNQNSILKSYKDKLPKKTVTALPLQIAFLTFNKLNNGKLEMPLVNSVNVPGLKVSASQSGGFEIADTDSVVMGGGLSGQVQMSLLGVCQMYDRQAKEIRVPNPREFAKILNANMSFAYNLQVRAHYTAQYNLGAFVSRIATQETTGGFFRSEIVNKLIEDRHSEDWFVFDGKFEDPSMRKENLEAEVKAQVIGRVFANAKALGFGGSTQVPDALVSKPHGAAVGAEELQKCPYIYCQIGAGVLRFADAVFGSDSAMQAFISNNSFWAKDDVESSMAFTYRGTTLF